MEKVRVQLGDLFDDDDVVLSLVRVIGQLAPNLDAHFRDDC
jgi:hypothetical protein